MNTNLFNYTLSSNGCGTFKIVFPGPFYLEYENKQFGLCHVIEHCMCERVKEIENELKMNGIVWNGLTTSSHVCFYMYGLIHNVKKMINKFLDCIMNYSISEEVFNREIKIIKEEYYKYYTMSDDIFRYNFNLKRLGMYDPIGSFENIENFTYDEMMEFKNKYFNKPLLLCYAHPKNSKDISIEQFSVPIEFSPEYPIKEFFLGDYNEYKTIENEPNENNSIIRFYTVLDVDSSKDDAMLYLFSRIIGNGLSGPLYQEFREKNGDVYSITRNQMLINEKQIIFLIDLRTSKDPEPIKDKLENFFNSVDKFINRKTFNIGYKNIQNGMKMEEYLSIDCDFEKRTLEYKNYFLSKDNKIKYDEFINFVKKIKNSKKYIVTNKDHEFQ